MLAPASITLIVLALIIIRCSVALCTEDEAAQPQIASIDTIYAYREGDKPDVFFFPKEKARWDGSKVTMKEWYMLTGLQKEKFVTEYIDQLKTQSGLSFEAVGIDYLGALNLFSLYSNEKSVNEPSTKFIDRILTGQGKLSSAAGAVQGGSK